MNWWWENACSGKRLQHFGTGGRCYSCDNMIQEYSVGDVGNCRTEHVKKTFGEDRLTEQQTTSSQVTSAQHSQGPQVTPQKNRSLVAAPAPWFLSGRNACLKQGKCWWQLGGARFQAVVRKDKIDFRPLKELEDLVYLVVWIPVYISFFVFISISYSVCLTF